MRLPLQISVAAVVLASAATVQGQMRFQGMDTNGDGVITRSEWRGNDNSFRNQDWNGDLEALASKLPGVVLWRAGSDRRSWSNSR